MAEKIKPLVVAPSFMQVRLKRILGTTTLNTIIHADVARGLRENSIRLHNRVRQPMPFGHHDTNGVWLANPDKALTYFFCQRTRDGLSSVTFQAALYMHSITMEEIADKHLGLFKQEVQTFFPSNVITVDADKHRLYITYYLNDAEVVAAKAEIALRKAQRDAEEAAELEKAHQLRDQAMAALKADEERIRKYHEQDILKSARRIISNRAMKFALLLSGVKNVS